MYYSSQSWWQSRTLFSPAQLRKQVGPMRGTTCGSTLRSICVCQLSSTPHHPPERRLTGRLGVETWCKRPLLLAWCVWDKIVISRCIRVLVINWAFMMWSTQNHCFRVCCIQISQTSHIFQALHDKMHLSSVHFHCALTIIPYWLNDLPFDRVSCEK